MGLNFAPISAKPELEYSSYMHGEDREENDKSIIFGTFSMALHYLDSILPVVFCHQHNHDQPTNDTFCTFQRPKFSATSTTAPADNFPNVKSKNTFAKSLTTLIASLPLMPPTTPSSTFIRLRPHKSIKDPKSP